MSLPTPPPVLKRAPGVPVLSLVALGAISWLASAHEPDPEQATGPAVSTIDLESLDGIARGQAMATYAKGFLQRIGEAGRELATAEHGDPERRQWAFGPVRREGIRLDQLDKEQFGLLEALLDTALSEKGMQAWHEVRELESVLRKLESTPDRVAAHRDPNLYWLRVYGTPASTERWSWRFEGHHLALHVACSPGAVPTVTPFFVGANPLFGASQGKDLTPQVTAFTELNAALKTLVLGLGFATSRASLPELSKEGPQKRPGDIRMGPGHPDLPPASGITQSLMDESTLRNLDRLLETYLELLEPDLRTFRLEETDPARVSFSRWGGTEVGEPRTWTILTDTFALELATTDGPHHVHALLRDINRDFGGPE